MVAKNAIVGGLVASVLVAGMAAQPDLRLVTAAEQQHPQRVRELVGAGVDVNAATADGATALLWAVHWDDHDLVSLLLGAGADPNAAEDHGITPLAMASENASAEMVEVLLAAGVKPDAAQTNGVTPLITASGTGNVRIVETLLARGANANTVIPSTGQTALMWATAERHVDIMQQLLAAGADPNAKSTIGFAPLMFASRNGDLEAATVLLDAGAAMDEPGSDGTHALPLAVVSGHADVALLLLDRGANPDATMFGISALHAAAGNVDMWLRDWLYERGSNTLSSSVGLGKADRVRMVKALLDHGADPNARISTSGVAMFYIREPKKGAFETFSVGTGDLKGATPLWVAAWNVHGYGYRSSGGRGMSDEVPDGEIFRLLLEGGADWSLTTDDQTTPLMAAAGLGHSSFTPETPRGRRTPDAEAAVRMLIAAGADINAVNEANFTALHGAAFKGLNEVIEYLVEQGADIDAQDFRGRTAFRMAEGSKQSFQFQAWPETAELLASLGANTTVGMRGEDLERQLERDAKAETTAGESR